MRAPCGMPCARKPDRPCRAGRRTQRCPPLPAVWFSWAPQAGLPPGSRAARARPDARHGIVVPRSPKGAAGPKPTDRHAAGAGGGHVRGHPVPQSQQTSPFGMRRGGQRGHGRQCGGQAPCAAHPTAVDRILGREPRTRGGACRHAKGRPTGGVKGGKAARGDAKRARRPKIWATATPGREPNPLPSRIYSI